MEVFRRTIFRLEKKLDRISLPALQMIKQSLGKIKMSFLYQEFDSIVSAHFE